MKVNRRRKSEGNMSVPIARQAMTTVHRVIEGRPVDLETETERRWREGRVGGRGMEGEREP